ncbi:niacin transporter niaP [Halarchaeum acidiphilum MH1-52-1]|uniref:Niacin transporter niaP n=1 Tax=Halarchaeum acidiphilum MH1-52-1 TaxID=1261545 RepID=U3A7A4_9EURY|nr:MFS transporter [Halarchaeum acidiphilum]GAD53564.1 niacin transporter niaP [Halarchaeum acidiphilum MH1-52-1]
MPDTDTTSVSGALDRISINAFHRRLLAVCGTAWAFDGMEVILISFTLPVLLDAWGLSGPAAGLLGSASLMGMIVGNWGWGYAADRYGRKPAFQWTVLTYAVFAGLTALAVGFYTGFALRFLTGVGLGGALAVDTSYLSEHLPTDRRGRYLVYLDAFWPLGYGFAVAIAWLFLSYLPSGGTVSIPVFGAVAGWRLLFVASAIPGLLVFAVRYGLSETPYYLARAGKIEAANERLRAIAAESGEEYEPITIDEVESRESAGVRDLFAADLRARTITIALAWFAINFGYYGVFIWLPQTFGASGTVPALHLGGATFGGVYGYFLLIALVQFPGYASAAYLVERVGRKRTLGTYLLASGVFTFVFASAMPGAGFGLGVSGFWPFFVALLASSFFTLGAWGAIYAYTPELFPTELRATGNGFAGGVGKIAAVVGPVLAGALVPAGYVVALLPLAVAFGLGGAIVLAFGVETMGTPLG